MSQTFESNAVFEGIHFTVSPNSFSQDFKAQYWDAETNKWHDITTLTSVNPPTQYDAFYHSSDGKDYRVRTRRKKRKQAKKRIAKRGDGLRSIELEEVD